MVVYCFNFWGSRGLGEESPTNKAPVFYGSTKKVPKSKKILKFSARHGIIKNTAVLYGSKGDIND